MKTKDIKSGVIFEYKGKKYMWCEDVAGKLRHICDENGNQIPIPDIPFEVIFGLADVEEVK